MDITFTNRDISFNLDGEDAWNGGDSWDGGDNIQRPDYYSSISAEIISLRNQTDLSLSAFFSSIHPLIQNSNSSYSLKIDGELTELSNNVFIFKNLITDMENGTTIIDTSLNFATTLLPKTINGINAVGFGDTHWVRPRYWNYIGTYGVFVGSRGSN